MDNNLGDLFRGNRGGVIGAIVGILLALLFVRFGLFQILFLVLCAVVGFILGSQGRDDNGVVDERVRSFIYENRGKIVGTLIGVFIALFFLDFGFLRAIFIILLGAVGFYLGARKENRDNLKNIFENIINGNKE
ncbi:DUF2273 domain-containing protein [Eubacteriales bacterium OttesenSCG-928-N14]|nr:DUF2273 domain-containing protein [Eubacteriales bacterium OttesenSCG-928-N14]